MEANESVQRKHQNRKQRNQKKGECWNDLKKLLTQRSILYYYQIRFFFGRYDRIKDIQEPVEHCKGRDIQWMFFSAQEKPQASTNYVCVLCEASDIHIATGCTRAQRERLDLDQPTKMERATI